MLESLLLRKVYGSMVGCDIGDAMGAADEAMQLGERIATLARVFNLREGLTTADDRLPERFFSGTRRGSLVGIGIDRAAMQDAIVSTYQAMGWDRDSGVPRRETLVRLGIAWAAEHLG